MPTTRGPRPDPPFVYGVPLTRYRRRLSGSWAAIGRGLVVGLAFGAGFAFAFRVLG